MRRWAATAVAALTALGYVAAGRMADERNVRALAEHVGCSIPEARRLYRLSRKIGYGAAYAEVFPGKAIPGIAQPEPPLPPAPDDRAES